MTTGDNIGQGIATVGDVVAPIISSLAPGYGTAVTLAFKVLAVVEPAAYNAIAALVGGATLTPEQQATIADVETRLANPDSYLA